MSHFMLSRSLRMAVWRQRSRFFWNLQLETCAVLVSSRPTPPIRMGLRAQPLRWDQFARRCDSRRGNQLPKISRQPAIYTGWAQLADHEPSFSQTIAQYRAQVLDTEARGDNRGIRKRLHPIRNRIGIIKNLLGNHVGTQLTICKKVRLHFDSPPSSGASTDEFVVRLSDVSSDTSNIAEGSASSSAGMYSCSSFNLVICSFRIWTLYSSDCNRSGSCLAKRAY